MEARRAIEYFRKEFGTIQVNKVISAGDASLLPGLIPYAARFLGIEVQMCNPFQGIKVKEQFNRILSKSAPGYVVAVGLALKKEF